MIEYRVFKEDLLFDLTFSALVFLLPFSMAIPNIMLIVLIFLFILKEKKIWVNKYLLICILFTVFLISKPLLNNNFIENLPYLKFYLLFIILTFLAVNVSNMSIVKKGFILGVFLASVISLIKITAFFFNSGSLPMGNSEEVKQLLLISRPYFGFMSLMASFYVYESFLKEGIKPYKKVSVIFLISFFLFFIFLIVSRLSMILASIFVLMILMKSSSLLKKIFYFLSIIVFMAVLIDKNEAIKERFHIEGHYNETINRIKNQEPRFVIWNCALRQTKNSDFSFILGYSDLKQIQNNLNNCYSEIIENLSKRKYYLDVKFNTHNQFIDVFLQGGIIGLSLFCTIFLVSFYYIRKNKLIFFLIIGFVLFCFVENLFQRQIGTYLLAVFIPISFLNNTKSEYE